MPSTSFLNELHAHGCDFQLATVSGASDEISHLPGDDTQLMFSRQQQVATCDVIQNVGTVSGSLMLIQGMLAAFRLVAGLSQAVQL